MWVEGRQKKRNGKREERENKTREEKKGKKKKTLYLGSIIDDIVVQLTTLCLEACRTSGKVDQCVAYYGQIGGFFPCRKILRRYFFLFER